LRAQLQDLIDRNEQLPTGLAALYDQLLAEMDELLSANPLEIKIGETILEIEVSEAMRTISEEYQRLGLVSLNDYHRLPGVTMDDLAGLERLIDHINRRQVGTETSIPVFDSLSPFGNFTLVDRLIRKYGGILLEQTSDHDIDGKLEIDYELFRGLINGSEIAAREAVAIIAEVIDSNPIPWNILDSSPVSSKSLRAVLTSIDSIEQQLENATHPLALDNGYDEVFETIILSRIQSLLRKEHRKFIGRLEDHIKQPSTPLEILPEANLPEIALDGPLTHAELDQFVPSLEQWNQSIRNSVAAFLGELEISEQLEDSFKSILNEKLNGYGYSSSRTTGLYELHFLRLQSALALGKVIFSLPGGHEIEIDLHAHPIIDSLPNRIADLLKYPGIASNVSEEELMALTSTEDWSKLSRVTFLESPQFFPDELSPYGRDVELLAILLEEFGNTVITGGDFDSLAFAQSVLMSQELKTLIDTVDQSVLDGIERIENIDIDIQVGGLSKEDYREMLDALKIAKQAIRENVDDTVAGLDDSIRSTFETTLQERYHLLTETAEAILAPPQGSITSQPLLKIAINQNTYSVPTQSAFNILAKQLHRIAVVEDYHQPTRRQYIRLNGVTEKLALQINAQSHFSALGQLWTTPTTSESIDPLDIETDRIDAVHFLLPSILESFGQEIISEENRIDLSLFKEKLLQAVFTPVQDGVRLRDRHIQIASHEINQARSKLLPLNMNTWEDRIEAERIYYSMERVIVETIASLIQELDTNEIQVLEQDYLRYSDPSSLYRNYIDLVSNLAGSNVSLAMQDGETFNVPLRDIKAIPYFPWDSFEGAPKLFPGIEDSDREASKQLSLNIVYTKNGTISDEDRYQGISRDKLIINVLTRYYNDPQFERNHPKADLFKDGEINVEVFRRIIKGIDALHREVLAQSRLMTNEALEKLEALTKSPMTVENALAVYNVATDLQNSITEYLTSLTAFHEREDVIEMEEALTAIHKNVIGEMIDYYRGNELVIDADGTLVTIPVQQISDELVKQVEARFPGEGIDAHHFAAIAGISVEDLRGYNKLEEFLGAQIIALPRNSQFVEIQSKLSEIGFMQMASDVVMRYFDEVVDVPSNQIDIDSLLALLTDVDLSFDRVLEVVQSIHDQAIDKLNTIQNLNTIDGFEEALRITNDLKLETKNRVNDHISYFTSDQFTEIQAHIDTLFQDFRASREAQLIGLPITIDTVDHQTYTVNLSEIENSVAKRLEALILENPHPEPDDRPIFGFLPSFDGREGLLPWPTPQRFDPDHTLSQFGFHILMARLIEGYGTTVSENGTFSLDKFLEELGKPNADRSEELFENLKRQAISHIEAKAPEGDHPIPLQDILALDEFLNESRTRFYSVLDQLDPISYFRSLPESPGNAAWLAVVNHYEALLFNRDFTFQLDSRTLTVPTTSLVDLMHLNYSDGYTDLLDSNLAGGESLWFYYRFKHLHARIDFSGYTPTTNFSLKIENGQTIDPPRYPFNLGDLSNVPGITIRNLTDLETEQAHRIQIEQIPAAQLLTTQFNLRILNPGSPIQTIGRTASLDSSSETLNGIAQWYPASSFLELSPRDIRYRLLVKLIQTYAEILVDSEGNIDLEAFEILLQTEIK